MEPLDHSAGQVIHISGKKSLLITNNEIQYRYKKWGKSNEQIIPISEITGTRYGVEWLHGLKMIIGRRYIYRIKTDKKEVVISFISLYRIKLDMLTLKYTEIFEKLWECYWVHIVSGYLEELKAGKTISLMDISIGPRQVIYKKSGKTMQVPLSDLGLKKYETYMAICDNKDPMHTYLAFTYKDDWNTMVLAVVIDNLLKQIDTEHK